MQHGGVGLLDNLAMRKIYFVRHGQSVCNVGGVTMEHAEIPLTGTGKAQAHLLAQLLPERPAEVLVSPFKRARSTAAPYCEKHNVVPWVQSVLREFETFDTELIAGMNGDQRKPVIDVYWDEASPSKRMGDRAETFQEFDARVNTFMECVMPTLQDRTVVFGHGMWLACLVWKLLGFKCQDVLGMKSFRAFQLGLPMPNGAIYEIIELAKDEWRVNANETSMRAMNGLANL